MAPVTRLGRASGLLVVVASLVALVHAAAGAPTASNVGWAGFGNTPDEIRHTPLTLIDKSNVDQLGRLFTLDFNKYFPGTRRGTQSYPVVIGDTMYITTNEGNTYALDATTGAKKWSWSPPNIAVYNKAGIVANRGVAACDGKVFVLTIDMTINALDRRTGDLIARIPISRAVPGATTSYGYSETSAPICAEHKLIVGGVTWTPTTVDTTTHTLYFGTGSATPLYYSSIRPGSAPRTDSLVAVDLR